MSFTKASAINFVDGKSSYLPKRLTKSPIEKEPIIPPTEKMATESDHRAVKVFHEMGSENLWVHVSL